MIEHTPIPDPEAPHLPDDIPTEIAEALMNSMVKVVRDAVSVDISVTRERIPCGSVNLSMYAVTLPPDLTDEQRAEIDDVLQEISGLFWYAPE